MNLEKNNFVADFPSPMGVLVVIKNPILAKKEETQKVLKTLPDAEKEKYLMENMLPEFDSVEVLAKGPNCVAVEVGKKYAVKVDSVMRDKLTLSDMKYLYVRESEFFAVW